MILFVFTDSVQKLLLADGGQGLEVLQRLLERLLGGVVLGSLDAEVHLVLEGVRHAVAREHHAGVHQQHVAQRVPERVVLLRAMLTINWTHTHPYRLSNAWLRYTNGQILSRRQE